MTLSIPSRIARPAAAALLGAVMTTALNAAADETSPTSIYAIEQISDVVSARIALSGSDNNVIISQDGKDLHADVSIAGSQNTKGFDGEADTNVIEQSGVGSSAMVSVAGSENGFVIRQSGDEAGVAANNSVELVVAGDANRALIEQSNPLGDLYGNIASVSQFGYGNSAQLSQTTSETTLSAEAILSGVNMISLVQDGVGNTANLEQTGGDNLIDLTQTGDNHNATIQQNGANLSAVVTQQGTGDAYTLTQTGCAVASCQVVVNRYNPGG